MSRVNAHVNGEIERLKAEWVAGVEQGMESNPNVLPEFFVKPYMNMTARERGFIFGRGLTFDEKLYAGEKK